MGRQVYGCPGGGECRARRAVAFGTYVMTGGLLVGNTVRLTRDADDTPLVEVVGFETVRRTVGLP
ncbi:hypothetical protein [Kitasatospora sp. DSM 101779]|uniref:hypothetical protein n=1 Tax=Kitasatospora sp. DSM 101779 TaxID=2853165 RepID=UPI0021DA50E0|nr:hypothetical protein [Kitasatospora sp. DSM 101779]MCU7820396.1 hypothetical protein [Kitasatospora sp. DSM 101779]